MAGISALPYPRPGRRFPTTTVAVVAVLVIIVAILSYTGVLAQARRYIPGYTDTTPVYQTSSVSKGNISVTVTATGPISAVENLPLTFKESGRLNDIKVNVGDKVTKGQLLATLDTTDLQNSLDQAKANLLIQQANLAKLQAGATAAARDVAQTSIDTAKSSAADASTSIDTSKTTAAKSIDSSKASVASSQTSLATAQSGITAAQDQEAKSLASDQLAIDNAQKNLDVVTANVAANVPVLNQAVETAKNSLYSAQVSRDATCSHPGTSCNAANASVNAAESSVTSANYQLTSGLKQGQGQVEAAQASLDSAKAAMVSDKSKQDAAVVSAQNGVKQAQAALASAQVSLGQAEASATATVQTAQNSASQAANAVKSAQANYNQVVQPPTQADIDTANAQIANAQSAVESAQINFDSANLVAPFDGTIAAVNGNIGQWISGGSVAATTGSTASATAIFTLMSLSNLQVVAQVNEADISKVALNNPVNFNVSAFPDKTFTGKVLSIQPVGTTVSNVVNYNVTSSIQSDATTQLYPGMTATVTVVTAEHDNVLMVPNTAITFAQSAFRSGALGGNRQRGANGTPVSGQGPQSSQTDANGTPVSGQGQRQGQAGANGTPASGQGQRQGQAGANGTPGAGQGQRQGNGNGGGGQGGQGRAGGGGQFSVIIAMVDGKLTPMRVTFGLTDGTSTEVTGLKGDESIVVGPIPRTTTGATGTRPAGGPGGGGFGGGAIQIGGGGRGG